MSLTTPTISNFAIRGTLGYSQIDSQVLNQTLNFGVTFADVTFLKYQIGTFTPANNISTIVSVTASENPNFVLFTCDSPTNLVFNNNSIINSLPIQKAFLWTGVSLSTSQFTLIQLDGRTNAPFYVMQQGLAIHYEIWYGKATIS